MALPPPIGDTKLGAQALAYVIELYHELTAENGAPILGNQNQAVDFIRSDPELRRAVAAWAETVEIDEATTAPRRRLPLDALYDRVRAFLERTMAPSVFLDGVGVRRLAASGPPTASSSPGRRSVSRWASPGRTGRSHA